MCILFVAVNEDVGGNEYKLILASNRDEFYSRKARPAHWWEDSSTIIGGMDMEPGREGGTWLAMKRETGRVGSLLNICTPTLSLDKRGRGSLVTDFLKSPRPSDVTSQLQREASEYNPFILLMIDSLSTSTPELVYFNSTSKTGPCRLKSSGVYGFGNSSSMTCPFKKVEDGKAKFDKLVAKFNSTANQDQLLDGILEILKNRDRHLPDPQLKKQARSFSTDLQENLSCRFVESPGHNYGTRTHTIIFVTGNNDATFEEWTLDEPISTEEPKWIHSKYTFRLPTCSN